MLGISIPKKKKGFRMKYLLLSALFVLTGCASIKGLKDPSITVLTNRVEFHSSKSIDMSYKKGDEEYKYSSKSDSLLSKIVTALGLGVIGARR